MLLAILALGCGGVDGPAFGAGGERSDTPAGGAGTGGSGTDTGSDTAGDDTAATGDPICDGTDLDFTLGVEDEAGTTGQAFTWPATITSRAQFVNPCAGLLSFTTPTSCLVDTWTLTDGSGGETSFSGNCVSTPTTWSLQEGEGTTVVAEWGTLDRGNWQVAAASDAVGTTVTEFFSVQ